MHLISGLAILCLTTFAAAEVLSHGKIVACPTMTYSVLKAWDSEFKYNETDWNLCTRIIVLDDLFLHKKGTKGILLN